MKKRYAVMFTTNNTRKAMVGNSKEHAMWLYWYNVAKGYEDIKVYEDKVQIMPKSRLDG